MELSEIKGLGKKRIENLKNSGIESVSDLLAVFPCSYIDLTATVPPSIALQTSDAVTLRGKVASPPAVRYMRRKLFLTTCIFEGDGFTFECGWFNRYMQSTLSVGKEFFVYGKVERYGKKLSVKNAMLIACEDNDIPVYPLYRPIKGVPPKVFAVALNAALDGVKVKGFFDEATANKFGLMELNAAFTAVHRPKSVEMAEKASRSIATEHLGCNIAAYSLMKKSGCKPYSYGQDATVLKPFLDNLPFKLSDDQSRALDEIISDLNSSKKMNRLLQGDVGSGKTVVALASMLYAALNGFQSVLMCPTEILAKQHFLSATRFLSGFNLGIEFFSSSVTGQKRRDAAERLKSGESAIAIGTHSLLGEDVTFKNLSLIIADEQQRFGVKQRGMLENKAIGADYLVMTATPIPRTLALTVYGDLSQSRISTIPHRKAKVVTRKVPPEKTDAMYDYVAKKAEEGEQTYIVCPRIEDDGELVSAEGTYEKILSTRLKRYAALLHGGQSEAEKSRIMSDFQSGKTKVLVTTSVIEVGIDVPTATTIIIYNAERYGLSQLHQLRGRVGRGDKDGYCFLPCEKNETAATERIDYFISCNDGFSLSEYDFRLRGGGDFLGTRQHGDAKLFSFDADVIDRARRVAEYLTTNAAFCEKLFRNFGSGELPFVSRLTLN